MKTTQPGPTAADPAKNRVAGFSLVELMVAMTLGLILMAGVVTIVANTSQSHAELDKSSRQLENGRYAIQTLRDDIRHAGFFGEYSTLTAPAAAPLPCDTDLVDLRTSINLPVQGYAGGSDSPLDCLPDYVPDTDVLVIRRASTTVTPVASLAANEVYLQSRSDSLVIETGADATVFNLTQRDGATPADIRKLVTHIYYIRNCSNCAGGGDNTPTLARAELLDGNLNTVLPIAEGIENLQLRYGVDDNSNGAPDRFITLPANVTDWFNVVTIEANILARNVDQTPGHTDSKTYTLGDVTINTPGDSFKRHVFTTLARAVNPSSRREQ